MKIRYHGRVNRVQRISLSAPQISRKEIRRVVKVLKSGLLAQGQEVATFEQNFSQLHNENFSVAVNSGTSALHLGILGLQLGDQAEVLCPAFTFAASANAISLAGAKPVFVDVDPQTFNIDVGLAETVITPMTKAILVVHLYGLPADMTRVMALAKKFNLKVIEDAAQAHLASIEDRRVGTFGDVAAFSFYPTKNMTSGEGGMIVTKHKEIDEFARKMRNQGMKIRYENDLIGFNLRMTDIHAALGIEQLKKLPNLTNRRIDNATFLSDNIKNPDIFLPVVPKGFRHVFHQYTLKTKTREDVIDYFQRNRIDCGVYYPIPVPHLKSFKSKEFFPVAQRLAKEALSIPVHPGLSRSELKRISRVLNEYKALQL